MTIGIYCLKFNGTDKVYIGQSDNIERRFKEHLRLFKNYTASTKLQEAYNTYGSPNLLILAESSLDDLDIFEDEAISIYNSVNNGFNTYSYSNQAPTRKYGEESGNAKFTNGQILEVFFLLISDKYYSADEISKITQVSSDIISKISCCSLHNWIRELYPMEYDILISKKYTRKAASSNLVSIKLGANKQGIKYPSIKSPEGIIFEIDNAYRFAKERGLAPNHFQEVLNGHRKSHKGWRLLPCQ